MVRSRISYNPDTELILVVKKDGSGIQTIAGSPTNVKRDTVLLSSEAANALRNYVSDQVFVAGDDGAPKIDWWYFDRFTIGARSVLTEAVHEAKRFNHQYVGTEHLLLGILIQHGSIAETILLRQELDPKKIRSAIEFIIGRGEHPGTVAGLTPRAMLAIKLAIQEAARYNHDFIGTGHLLAGLLRENEGIAVGVLQSFCIDFELVYNDVQQGLPPLPRESTRKEISAN